MPEVNKKQFKQFEQTALPGIDPGPVDHMSDVFYKKPEERKVEWKMNFNQMALPGMEEHAHPGSTLLTQGYRFEPKEVRDTIRINAYHDDNIKKNKEGEEDEEPEKPVAHLTWWKPEDSNGEIEMVKTENEHRGRGLANALYGMGRDLSSVKPEHSPSRTRHGNYFAFGASKKFGGKVPANDYSFFHFNEEYPEGYDPDEDYDFPDPRK
jgi:hypothetical protein